jgi:hypothetical protein
MMADNHGTGILLISPVSKKEIIRPIISPRAPGKITEAGSKENRLSMLCIRENSLSVNDFDNMIKIIPVMIALDIYRIKITNGKRTE